MTDHDEFQRPAEFNDRPDHEGRYADEVRVGYDAYKFVLDFGQQDLVGKGKNFHTRIILSPDAAKQLMEIFEEGIKDFQQTFGLIRITKYY